MITVTLVCLLMTEPKPRLTAGDTTRTLSIDGRERSYLVHAPANYSGDQPMPVVLAFHGGGSTAGAMVGFCGLNDKADAAGFLVVYPSGTGRIPDTLTWNSGNCCGYAMRRGVDDVRFVASVLDDLNRVANVDPHRVYATGMSNGAMLAYRLADRLSDRIAAIAPVAGPMGTAQCQPKRPVPVLHFHGTDDQFAPLAGGKGSRSLSRTEFFSVQHSIDCWVKANGCGRTPQTTKLTDASDDGMSVTQTVFSGGTQGAEVVLVEIQGGGHTWPGRVPHVAFLGRSTLDVSANDMMWAFFQRHSRR